MRCLDPVLRLATRSTGRAWRSVSRRFFFRFVSPRPVLLFHSFRTISLRFGESRLLWWLACLSSSPICPSSTPSCFSHGEQIGPFAVKLPARSS